MKKLQKLLTVLVVLFSLVGCANNKDSSLETIKVGASPIPHALILNAAKPLLKEKGYNLIVIEFDDYVLPNKGLTSKDLDANYFQHLPYLNHYNQENNTDIVSVGGVHIEPIGIYSKKYKSLAEIEKGTTVVLSNSVSDHGRLLGLLVDNNLITLKEGVSKYDATLNDILDNPKELVFKADIDPGLLVTSYNYEANSIVLINTNYALAGGLNPLTDALTLEAANQDNPYVNIIATLRENQNSPKIQALIEVLNSITIKEFILNEFNGSVIPAQ
jgi:D-methionine transport system substrate-binding protein